MGELWVLLEFGSEDSMKLFQDNTSWIRAKETPGWVPDFMEENDDEEQSDVDSKEGEFKVHDTETNRCYGIIDYEMAMERGGGLMGDFNELKFLKATIREWNKSNMLSVKNVKAKYKEELEALEAIIDRGGFWSKDLYEQDVSLLKYFVMGAGVKAFHWGRWNRFQRIDSLESCKLITVGAKLTQPSLEYSFRRNPRGGVEEDQFNELSALVHDVSLIPMSDRWKWDLRALEDFLGIDIDSIMCVICDNGVETSRHLFFYCCMKVRKRHCKSGTKSNAIFALPGRGSTSSVGRKSNAIFALPGRESTSSVSRKSNAIFALPGRGSTSYVGRKSNAIFALPGGGSTSSVGRKSNAIFALPDHGSMSSVGLYYVGSAFTIINNSHHPLVRDELEWYHANASVTPTIESVFFLRGLYRLATGNQACERLRGGKSSPFSLVTTATATLTRLGGHDDV
ncbi:hypothetical protein Tco_0044479 [Tanacetum coccineum]